MRRYQLGAHTKTDVKVHLIWIPKYRKRVLTGQVAVRVREVLRQIALEHELDKDIATIPSAPPPSSSSDNNGYGNTGVYSNGNDDSIFNNNPGTRAKPRRNNQPYTYGGNYGGMNQTNGNSKSGQGNNGTNNNTTGNMTDIFGGGRNSDESNNSADVSNGVRLARPHALGFRGRPRLLRRQ